MATTTTTAPDAGVLFPQVDGRRSTATTARAVFADALRAVDADAARAIETAANWHRDYVHHVRTVEATAAASAKNALAIARDGIESLHARMVFARDGEELSLRAALARWREPAFETATVVGSGRHPGQLAVPYRGEELTGDALLRRIDAWVAAGVIEPSCAQALGLVVANPDWLDAADLTVALVGAAAEMGPLEPLSRWGATVAAVDVASPAIWRRVLDAGRHGCGRLLVPVRSSAAAGRADLVDVAGADVLADTPEIRTWLDGLDGPIVVGNYGYADGAAFVRVAVATDALVADLVDHRPGTSIAYLASPTDVFAVPAEIIDAARAGAARRAVHRLARTATGGRLYTPSYRFTVTSDEGTTFGLADSLVTQQGPNYALAKRMQRWRAVLARETTPTSANVAPATRTRSVLKNRVLSAAYAGAGRFGVEVFEPATSHTLMAALLIHDLRNQRAVGQPSTPVTHPLTLFADAAAHGGLWRLGYEPRSVLPLAVVMGIASRRG